MKKVEVLLQIQEVLQVLLNWKQQKQKMKEKKRDVVKRLFGCLILLKYNLIILN
jgi:hypothetical protein